MLEKYKIDKAFGVIETLNKSTNHLGVFSEDADEYFSLWSNFPQTYSHVPEGDGKM